VNDIDKRFRRAYPGPVAIFRLGALTKGDDVKGFALKPAAIGMALVYFWIFLVFPINSALFAQETASACADAQRQATMDTSGGTWFAIGCLAGLIGWLIAYAMDSNPPASSLVGKSPEYVAAYSDCYKNKAKSIKTNRAMVGCLVGTTVAVVIDVVIITSSSSTTSSY
jgi:hypothetical protein